MKFSRFMLLNAAVAASDLAVTYGLHSFTDLSLILARSCGSAVAVAGVFLWTYRKSGSQNGQMLPVAMSIVTIAVNYGLFTLLYVRNAVLNWCVLFAITTVAALLLGAAGYRRALNKHTLNP